MIKLSLILPAYNTSEYLEKCVESCAAQDISAAEYEIIIVNDGSTDNTLSISEHLKKQYSNIVILNQQNLGLSMARNNGAAIAQGEYIWFIDSDDYIAKDCLGTILDILDRQNLDMLGVAPMIAFKEKFPADFDEACDMTFVMSGREWIENGIQFIGAWAYVFRKSFWANNKFSFYPGIYFEDTELIPKVRYKAGRIASFSTFSCYSYVQRQGSIMNSAMSEKKVMDLGKIVNSYSLFISDERERMDAYSVKHFEAIRSANFMAGIVNISKLKNKDLLEHWLRTIQDRPHRIYGSSLIHRMYQYLALRFPRMFFMIKQLIR